ncbi:MAG: hypothetical protein IJZ67_04215 [Alistipes sp.]|nr:hypothetical protein [Alistipes sp.]
MSKLLWRYFIYFVIFITMVQVFEYNGTQELCARWGFKINFAPLGVYAPLFLSVLLIDITYRIGKRQNEIAEQQAELQKQQNEFVKQQIEIQQQQYKIEKFNNYRDLHRDIYKSKCMLDSILPKIYEYFVAADRGVQNNSINEYISKLTELLFDIQNRVSDVMLRGEKQLDVQRVLDLLGSVGALLIKASQNPPLGMNQFDWITTIIKSGEFREHLTMDEQMGCINALARDQGLKAGMELFVKQYKEVFEGENNILVQLQRLYNE